MNRRAFTMVELLVVTGIIAVLAAIGLAVIPMIKRQTNDARCGNNLGQIGMGITAYQQDHNGIFPQSLSQMFDAGQALSGVSPGVLLCPWDLKKGTSAMFNREVLDPTTNLAELYDPSHDSTSVQPFVYATYPHSYMFEAANVALGPDAKGWWPSKATWFDAKVAQLRNGGPGGNPIAPEKFPILRCFWHATWRKFGNNSGNRKVLNLSWAMSTFWTVPEWETEL